MTTNSKPPPYDNYPKDKSFKLHAHPMYWVSSVNSYYMQTMEKVLRPLGMDLARWRICMILRAYGTLRVSKISQLAVNRLPTTTKIIKRMEQEGLLYTERDINDERIVLVSLSEAGYKKLEKTLEKTDYIFPRIYKGLTADEAETLIQLLKKIRENIIT